MRPATYQPPELSVDSDFHLRPARFLSAVDVLLAAGFCCTACAAGLIPFVIIGLLGLALFVVAFGLLLAAWVLVRAACHRTW